MRVHQNENLFPFDIDQTLISVRRKDPLPGDLAVINPYTNEAVFFKPNEAHIDLLKESFGRGRHILVWSAAGVRWAEAIINKLNLSNYVHDVFTKPVGYVDDKPCEAWMNNRIYLDEGER